MKLNWFQISLIIIIGIVIFRNTMFFEFELKGTYMSNAIEPVLEMPSSGCKLYILEDNKYVSDCMGEGTYKTDNGGIIFSNRSESWGMPMCRRFNIGNPMFMISGDYQYYMVKQ